MAIMPVLSEPINSLQIQRNLDVVKGNISRAAIRSGRSPDDVKLVVVTKTHPIETVHMALQAGATHLGENYVEEAKEKIDALGIGSGKCLWHMIGHVQSRKSDMVVEFFHYIHSVDSVKLARRLDKHAAFMGIKMPVMLELNVSGEETKGGWMAGDEKNWNTLLPEFEDIVSLANIQVLGLMTMAPFAIQPEKTRKYYRKLRSLQTFLREHISLINWNELSMGMSGDYEVAIEEGATWVRIGQAILGPRRV